MATRAETNCERLRGAFEGCDALYVEKGAVCVRVTNIRYNVDARCIGADVEEIRNPHLTSGIFTPLRELPRRWRISAGRFATFSEHLWQMGYGGWSLFFAPEIVGGLARLATDWPTDLDANERYSRALQFLHDHGAYEHVERVFPD